MGLLLLFLSCVGLTSYEYPLLQISSPQALPAIAIGTPRQSAQWADNPRIRICATSEVPVYRAAQAVRYWESIGYKFDGITKDPFSMCMNPRMGEILVTLPETGFADSHMASTRIYTHKETGAIVKAKIFILPKFARKDRVLEHEIGHALGWAHYRQKFHIMHPTWHLGGYDHAGIRG